MRVGCFSRALDPGFVFDDIRNESPDQVMGCPVSPAAEQGGGQKR